ncbi:MAG: hypothetical protein ISS57_10045 [Anaerolineales bacterium]|nr:hypothetical protein [Anaerolineales bacterium]
MENEIIVTENNTETDPTPEEMKSQTGVLIGIGIGTVVLIALVVVSVIFLLNPTTDTARFRDVFIIFMALESIVIGLALIILIIQIARLINLLQNEIKPIINSTNETVSTLRGTTQFLSDNLVEPVIKLNEYLAGLGHLARFIKPKKK